MLNDQEVRQLGLELRDVLERAKRSGVVFNVSGGRRGAHRITAVRMPETLGLNTLELPGLEQEEQANAEQPTE